MEETKHDKGNMVTLHDKRFGSKILHFEHSPTMDLIAIALDDKTIAVHRSVTTNFQRLFSISTMDANSNNGNNSNNNNIVSLAWKSNGKVLALGQNDGSIALYSVESGNLINMPLSAFPHSTSVTTLNWLEPNKFTYKQYNAFVKEDDGSGGDDANNDDNINRYSSNNKKANADSIQSNDYTSNPYKNDMLSNYLPGPQPLAQKGTFGDADDSATNLSIASGSRQSNDNGSSSNLLSNLGASSIICNSAFDVLVSGDSSGVVTLSAYGFFPIGCVDLSAAFEAYSISTSHNETTTVSLSRPTVTNVSLSPDLQILSVILRARILNKKKGNNDSDDNNESTRYRYHLVVIDTSLLWGKRRELCFLACQCGSIGNLISHMEDALAKMSSAWTQGLRNLQSKFNAFHKLIDGYGVSTTISTEFFNLYITGVPSNALDQFLSTSMNIGVATRIFKAIETSCIEIEDICVNHFIKPGENILFLLGELQAASRWPERFKRIGLNEKSIYSLIELMKHLILHGEKFISEIREARANFLIFSEWLIPTIIDSQNNNQDIVANMSKQKLNIINQMRQSVLERKNAKRLSALLDPTTSRDGEKDISLYKILHCHINKHFQTVIDNDNEEKKQDADDEHKNGDSTFRTAASLSIEHVLDIKTSTSYGYAKYLLSQQYNQNIDDSYSNKNYGHGNKNGLKNLLVSLKQRWQKVFHQSSETLSTVFQPIANVPIYTHVATSNSNIDKNNEKENKRGDVIEPFPSTPQCKFAFHVQHIHNNVEHKNGMDHFLSFTSSSSLNYNNVVWILKYNTFDIKTVDVRVNKKRDRDGDDISSQSENMKNQWNWDVYGIELYKSISILDMKFYGEHSGDAEFHSESQLLLLMKDGQNDRYVLCSILYNNLIYKTVPGPTLQSSVTARLNNLMEYIMKDCNINTTSFDDLISTAVDAEEGEMEEDDDDDESSVICKWMEVGLSNEGNGDGKDAKLSVSGTRGTVMVSIHGYKIKIYDAEDSDDEDEEDSDDDEDEMDVDEDKD